MIFRNGRGQFFRFGIGGTHQINNGDPQNDDPDFDEEEYERQEQEYIDHKIANME